MKASQLLVEAVALACIVAATDAARPAEQAAAPRPNAPSENRAVVARDITTFGATPDDDCDDAAAIQKAIDASAAGDTVDLPPGTFLIGSTLRAKTGVKIKGRAADRTILKLRAAKPIDCLDLSGTRDVELSGFTIDGGNSPNARNGVFAHCGGGHSIHHLVIQNLAGPLGIHFTGDGPSAANGVTDCTIADIIIRNAGVGSAWGAGIRLSWGSSRNQVLRNVIDNTGRGGILANDASCDLVIRGNTVTRSGRKAEKLGIEVWRDCDRVVIEDNTIDHWLSLGGCARVAARRNTVRATGDNVAFIGLEMIGQDLAATDNLIDGGQQIGVSVSNNAHNQRQLCAYNTVRNMVQWGAQLQGDRDGARMLYYYKNQFLATRRGTPGAIYPGADGRGFRFNGNCQCVTLDGSLISGNRAEGIELGGSGLDQISIVNNVIRGNGLAAVSGEVGPDLEWSNNAVSGNGTDRQLTSRGFANRPPVADFTCPTNAPAGQPASFKSTSTDPDGSIAHVLWEFGDGIPSTSPSESHTYAKPGTYRVLLVVWDNLGRAAIRERTIAVE